MARQPSAANDEVIEAGEPELIDTSRFADIAKKTRRELEDPTI